MKPFINATNIMVDSHDIIKNGYIQLVSPVKITEEWLNKESIIEGYDTNLDCILVPLKNNKIVETDLKPFIGKTIYNIPDESIYNMHLETIRQEMLMSKVFITDDEIQSFLERSDNLVNGLTSLYNSISDLLIQRMWSYILLKRNQTKSRYLSAYKTLCGVSSMQALLIIAVNTPKFELDKCFAKMELFPND